MIFPELDLLWNILIDIALGLAAIYFLTFLVNIIFVISFHGMMKRDNRGVRVAMSTKLDILKKYESVFASKKIALSEKTKTSLKYLDTEDFLEAQKEEFETSRVEMDNAEIEIMKLVSANKKKFSDQDSVLLESLLMDLNKSLNLTILSYNADVLGYNYWIRFAPYRYIFMLFRAKPKKTI